MSKKMYESFDALIVDSDAKSRGNLKQTMQSLTNFGAINYSKDLGEAETKLNGVDPCDVVFLSYRFELDEIKEFVGKAKKTKRGEDCAYCLVMRAKDKDDPAKISETIVIGGHGCLFEPYSAEGLREITEIAAKVKIENLRNREAGAVKLLLSEAIKDIDRLAFYVSKGKETGRAKKKLLATLESAKKYDVDLLEIYRDACVEMFGGAEAPPSLKYDGVSDRVKQKMEKKLMDRLEEMYKL